MVRTHTFTNDDGQNYDKGNLFTSTKPRKSSAQLPNRLLQGTEANDKVTLRFMPTLKFQSQAL